MTATGILHVIVDADFTLPDKLRLTRGHARRYECTRTRAHTQVRIRADGTRARTHTHTHTHTHAHQRTYVHTHMRAETPRVNVSCAVRARNEVKT